MTIAEATFQLIRRMPFMEEAMSQGLINLSSLARKIQPDITHLTGKPANEGAIIMALKRMDLSQVWSVNRALESFIKKLGDLVVRSNLVDYVYQNSDTLYDRQVELIHRFAARPKVFYSFSQGVYESTFIISDAVGQEVDELFAAEVLLKKTADLAAVTIMLPPINTEVYGIYYYILRAIAWQGINLVEIISTSNEFTLVVQRADIDALFTVLMKLKTSSGM